MTTTDQPFVAISEFGVETAEGKFENVIIGEYATKRTALKAAREFVAVNPDANVIITRGHSTAWDDLLTYVYADDFGRITTEKA